MADLVTRLLLNSSQFDNSIRQSTQQVQSFQKIGEQVKGTITKFVGVLGLAVSAQELFTTAINSNSITQNKWNDILGTAKESVDSFFTSLTTGDWSVWEGGILNAIRLSKKYTQALRELKSNLKIGDVRLSQDEKELNRFENLASDESNSKEVREKAFDDFKKKGKETVDYINGLSKSTNENLTTMLEGKGIKADKSVRNMIFNYLDTSTSGGKDLTKYTGKRQELEATKSLLENAYSMEGGTGLQLAKELEEERKALEESVKRMEKLNPELAEAYKLKINFNEEEVDELLDYTDKIIGLEDRLETAKKQVTDLGKDFDKDGKLLTKTTDKATKKVTSVPTLETHSISAGEYLYVPMTIPDKTLADLEYERSYIVDKMNHSNQSDYILLKAKLEKQDEEIDIFKKGGGMKIKGLDVSKATPLDLGTSEKVKGNNDYADSLNAVASAMSNVSKLTNEGAAAWINYAADCLNSTATMVQAIQKLIIAKQAETAANAAASAAQTPFVGWLLVGGAIATVLASFAALPKFANGGIIQGSSSFGDMNLARVNDGEMILNNRQQRNLFNLLNNGGSSSVKSANVEFKISGKQLVGVLNNYNNKVSKVR